jgi:hypothetical protein
MQEEPGACGVELATDGGADALGAAAHEDDLVLHVSAFSLSGGTGRDALQAPRRRPDAPKASAAHRAQ